MSARAGVRSQLRDDAAAYIRELIAVGRAPAGSHLSLDGIAATIGTSVTPVREALLLLAQDGIVTQERNRGFRVAPVGRDGLVDTYLVYAWIAGEIVARAVPRIGAEALAEVRRLEAEMASLADHEHERIEDLHYTLHELVFKAAESPRLEWFLTTSGRYVPRHFWATVPGWLEWNRTAHDPLLTALERRDVEAARRAMSEHVLHAGDLFIAFFEARERESPTDGKEP